MSVLKEHWSSIAKKEKDTAKFLRKGTVIMVDPNYTPVKTTVAGRFGERDMYIVNTLEYGLIFVSPIQLMHIVDVAKDDFGSPFSVEL